MQQQQQQPTSVGTSSVPQGSHDYSSSTMQQPMSSTMQQPMSSTMQQPMSSTMQQQQQPGTIGSSNAQQGLRDSLPTTVQQQLPTSTGTPGSAHKTHPTHPSATAGKHGHRVGDVRGNVFSRLRHFAGLPPDLQETTKQFEAFVEQHQQVVFTNNKHALVKTVYGVKGKELVDAIIQWLEARDAQPAQATLPSTVTMTTAGGEPVHPGGTTSAQSTPGQHVTTAGATGAQGAPVQQPPSVLPGTEATSQGPSATQATGLTGSRDDKTHGLTGNHGKTHPLTGDHTHQGLTGFDAAPRGPSDTHAAPPETTTHTHAPHVGSSGTHGTTRESTGKHTHHNPLSHGATHDRPSSSTNLHRAREIAEALVLSGFITPYKDVNKHTTHIKKHYVNDHELFVPVGKNVTELHTTSVWSVVDGATYAVSLKRKAGLKGVIADGKDVYVVFNEHNNMAYLFESDVARDVISKVHGETVNVQFESDHFPFGVLVESSLGDEKMKPELFNAESKRVQEEFANAWLSIGAQYRENSIKRIVEADSAKGDLVGSGVAGKQGNANVNQTTATGQQEVRGADLAATGAAAGAATGAGVGAGSSAMNQSNISAATAGNDGIGAGGGMPTTKDHRDHHSKTKDALYGAGAGAAAGAPLAHHDRHSASHEGQSNEGTYGATSYPPNQQDHHFASRQDPSANETPYSAAGATPSKHHRDHHLDLGDHHDPITEAPYGYEATTGSKHHHDHHLGRRDDPTYETAYGGNAASSKRQDETFGAQGGPSLAAPYGGATDTQSKHHHDHDHHLGGGYQDPTYDIAATPSKHHHDRHLEGQQNDPSPARHMADLAAAKIAGIEPTSQYSGSSSNASANQGSPAAPSKYNQEYPVGAHDTRTAP